MCNLFYYIILKLPNYLTTVYILTYPKIEYKLIYRLKNSVMQRLTNKG